MLSWICQKPNEAGKACETQNLGCWERCRKCDATRYLTELILFETETKEEVTSG